MGGCGGGVCVCVCVCVGVVCVCVCVCDILHNVHSLKNFGVMNSVCQAQWQINTVYCSLKPLIFYRVVFTCFIGSKNKQILFLQETFLSWSV